MEGHKRLSRLFSGNLPAMFTIPKFELKRQKIQQHHSHKCSLLWETISITSTPKALKKKQGGLEIFIRILFFNWVAENK